jgi:HrpA-like RNA helicase
MTHLLENYCTIERRTLNIVPLYSSLPQNMQEKAFETSIDRKIILSTNISESSVTVDGLYYVVDTGYVKVKVFDTEKSVETMMVMPCGKSSARQRLGRAGRVKKGECYRIYTLDEYEKMPDRLPPEILRIDLANYILKLKGLGIQDITRFEVLDPPTEFSLIKAI